MPKIVLTEVTGILFRNFGKPTNTWVRFNDRFKVMDARGEIGQPGARPPIDGPLRQPCHIAIICNRKVMGVQSKLSNSRGWGFVY